MYTTHSFFVLSLIGMAMSHQQNTFVPPTVEQRAQALGETDEVSIIKLKEKKIFCLAK